MLGALCLSGFSYTDPTQAMWLGFLFAAYSVVANDSIQTIGTFLVSNQRRPWWLIYLYLGGILAVTSYWSWTHYHGDVTFGRLSSKGFEVAPDSFTLLQIWAPLLLLVLTRLAIPVSTTFLILSCFATQVDSVGKVLLKSISGYGIAFMVSIMLWLALTPVFERFREGQPGRWWLPAQWVTSGCLWSVWLMQDAANVAVYLPRKLSLNEFTAFLLILLVALGILVRRQGGEIQQVISEKDNVADIRQATCIDLVYASILYYFKVVSSIPMSTTWVFIGLLAGRETGMTLLRSRHERRWAHLKTLVFTDLAKVTIGLILSLLLAALVNPIFMRTLLG